MLHNSKSLKIKRFKWQRTIFSRLVFSLVQSLPLCCCFFRASNHFCQSFFVVVFSAQFFFRLFVCFLFVFALLFAISFFLCELSFREWITWLKENKNFRLKLFFTNSAQFQKGILKLDRFLRNSGKLSSGFNHRILLLLSIYSMNILLVVLPLNS